MPNEYPESRREAKQPATRPDTFAVGRAKPPPHLDKVARKLFKQLAQRLTVAGVLRDVDEIGLGELCQAQSDVIRYTRDIETEGELTDGPNSTRERPTKVWNPKLGLLKDARRRVKEWTDRLGLSIKARAHLKFPAGAGAGQPRVSDDELERFLRGETWNAPDAPATGTDGATVPFAPPP